MQLKKIFFLSILIIFFIAGCNSKNGSKGEQSTKKETKVVLKTIGDKTLTFEKKGNKITIKELKNKIILLNFCTTWSPPCKAQMPHLVNLSNKYKNKFSVLGINMGDKTGNALSKEQMQTFILKHKIKYIITNGKENFKIAKLMGGVGTVPTMFMIDNNGKIIQEYVGVAPEEMIETDIKKILGK